MKYIALPLCLWLNACISQPHGTGVFDLGLHAAWHFDDQPAPLTQGIAPPRPCGVP